MCSNTIYHRFSHFPRHAQPSICRKLQETFTERRLNGTIPSLKSNYTSLRPKICQVSVRFSDRFEFWTVSIRFRSGFNQKYINIKSFRCFSLIFHSALLKMAMNLLLFHSIVLGECLKNKTLFLHASVCVWENTMPVCTCREARSVSREREWKWGSRR